MLQAADSQSLQQLLGAQLSRAVPPRVVSSDDVAAVMQLLSEAAVQQRRRSSGLGAQQQQVLLSLEVLLRWAGASTLNANRLVDAGAGHLLADLAAQTATGSGVDGLQSAIAQVCVPAQRCWGGNVSLACAEMVGRKEMSAHASMRTSFQLDII